jgi:hypothetical protein
VGAPGQHSGQPQHRAPLQAEPAHMRRVQLLQDQVHELWQGDLRALIGSLQQDLLRFCSSSSTSSSRLVTPSEGTVRCPSPWTWQHAPCEAASSPTMASTSSSVTVGRCSLCRIVGERALQARQANTSDLCTPTCAMDTRYCYLSQLSLYAEEVTRIHVCRRPACRPKQMRDALAVRQTCSARKQRFNVSKKIGFVCANCACP